MLSYRGKRSVDYSAQGKPYNILPPLKRRDLWDVSVDWSPYTVVCAYPNFDPNPGDPGRHVYSKTHAQAFLLNEVFEVGFELVSCRRRHLLEALVRWATGKRLTNRLPKVSLITLSPPSEQRDSWSSYGAIRAYSEVLLQSLGIRESDSSDS